MTETSTAAPPPKTARPRFPHVAGAAGIIALLAGGILFWTGQFPGRPTADRAALASAVDVAGTGPSLLATARDQPESVPAATHPREAEDRSSIAAVAPVPPPSHAEAILGTWKQYSYGHRLLKVMDDGTATIDVKLDGLSALAIGEKFRIDIEWTIDGDELVFKTTGGEPAASVNTVKALYGDNRVYQILEINGRQMLLQEGDEKKTPWDRVDSE